MQRSFSGGTNGDHAFARTLFWPCELPVAEISETLSRMVSVSDSGRMKKIAQIAQMLGNGQGQTIEL